MNYETASLNRRMAAFCLDSLGYTTLNILFLFMNPLVIFSAPVVLTLIPIMMILGVEILLMVLLKGRTIGKCLMGISVVDADTLEAPSITGILKRAALCRGIVFLFATITNSIGFCYLLYNSIVANQNEESQTIWDKKANTMVVLTKSL